MPNERAELNALRALRDARRAGDERAELRALRALRAARRAEDPAPQTEPARPAERPAPEAAPVELAGFNEALARTLGTPVDLANRALGTVGLSSERPVGGAESFRALLRGVIENPALATATAGSMLFPPLRAGLAATRVAPFLGRLGLTPSGVPGLTARGVTRFGPTIAAGGAGGAVGGAAEEAARGGSSLQQIAQAALESGQEMALAEGAGLAVTTPAARLAAPALGVMTDIGRQALGFARRTPLPDGTTAILGRPRSLPLSPADVAPGGIQRALQGVVDTLLPSRAVAQGRRRAVANRVLDTAPEGRANEVVQSLIRADTTDAALPKAQSLAERVAGAIGAENARRLGFGAASTGPRGFISRALQRGHADRLRRRLGDKGFDEVLTVNLERLIQGAVREVSGRRIIDGQRLLTNWRNLPEEVRDLYPAATREGVENFAAFAAASARVPELAQQGVFTFGPSAISVGAGLGPDVLASGLGATTNPVLFGVGSGVAALTARSLMNSRGLLNRWLTNERLPPEVLQVIGGQAVRTEARERAEGLLSEDDE